MKIVFSLAGFQPMRTIFQILKKIKLRRKMDSWNVHQASKDNDRIILSYHGKVTKEKFDSVGFLLRGILFVTFWT